MCLSPVVFTWVNTGDGAQYEAVMTGVTGDRNATPSNWHGKRKIQWKWYPDDAQVFLTRLNGLHAGNLPAGWVMFHPPNPNGNMPAVRERTLDSDGVIV